MYDDVTQAMFHLRLPTRVPRERDTGGGVDLAVGNGTYYGHINIHTIVTSSYILWSHHHTYCGHIIIHTMVTSSYILWSNHHTYYGHIIIHTVVTSSPGEGKRQDSRRRQLNLNKSVPGPLCLGAAPGFGFRV